MPRPPEWTINEITFLRQYAQQGMTVTEARAALERDGFYRTRAACKHAARIFKMHFHGQKGRTSRVLVCPRGHSIAEHGRFRSGQCTECAREDCRRKYRERRAAGYKRPSRSIVQSVVVDSTLTRDLI